ncbi:MAG: nucleotidyltransferase domain-containing protein [Candidatus Thorarchaeota archaeon]
MFGMRGENKIDTFRMIAKEFNERVSHFTSVEGILYIGGLARGFADKYSDVDIIVLMNNEDPFTKDFLPSISATLEDRSHVEMDVEVYLIDDFRKRDWDEYQRWDFLHSELAFDRTGNVAAALKQILYMDEDTWKVRIAKNMIYFTWYCSGTEEYAPTMIDLWIDRDDLISAEYSVNYGIDMLLELVYSLNRSFLPAPKWRYFYTRMLDWLPDGFEDNIREAMIVTEISEADSRRRAAALVNMWSDFLVRAEKEFDLTRQAIDNLYVKVVYGTGV